MEWNVHDNLLPEDFSNTGSNKKIALKNLFYLNHMEYVSRIESAIENNEESFPIAAG